MPSNNQLHYAIKQSVALRHQTISCATPSNNQLRYAHEYVIALIMDSKLKIISVPSFELLIPSRKVEYFHPQLGNLASGMLQTMRKNLGIGLAAPQIHYNLCIVVLSSDIKHIDHSNDHLNSFGLKGAELEDKSGFCLINPEILSHSEEVADLLGGEGCLSLPNAMLGPVVRYNSIELKYQNVHGEVFIETIRDILATVVQHEIDHLLGILYPARMEELARYKLLRMYALKQMIAEKRVDHFTTIMMQNYQNNLEGNNLGNSLGHCYDKAGLADFAKDNLNSDEIDGIWDRIQSINGTSNEGQPIDAGTEP